MIFQKTDATIPTADAGAPGVETWDIISLRIRLNEEKPHRGQFSDFSQYFVGMSLQMPPLRGCGFLACAAINIPSLRD